MKRRYQVLILTTAILSLLISISSCSKEKTKDSSSKVKATEETTNESTLPTFTPTPTSTPTPTPLPTNTPTPTPTPIPTYEIQKSEGFHEGRDWVSLGEPADEGTIALINSKGEILYKTDHEMLLAKLNIANVSGLVSHSTKMDHGYSVLYVSYNSNKEYRMENFLIIDQYGNEIYSSFKNNANDHYVFIEQFGDRFLVCKEVSSFSESSLVFQLVDPHGNIILDDVISDYDFSQDKYISESTGKLGYLGNGLYALDFNILDGYTPYSDWVYNYETNTFKHLENFLVEKACADGHIILSYVGNKGDHPIGSSSEDEYVEVSAEDIFNQDDFDNAIKSPENWFQHNLGVDLDDYNDGKWFDGDINDSPEYVDRVYKDKRGNTVLAIEDMPSTIDHYSGTPFENGYAFLEIWGADGNTYYCHIDETGHFLYEPMQFSDFSYSQSSSDVYYVAGGYVFIGDCYDGFSKVLTPEGKTLSIGFDDLSELENLEVVYKYDGTTILSNGFFNWTPEGITSLEGKVIDIAYEGDLEDSVDMDVSATVISDSNYVVKETSAETITFGSYEGEPIEWVVLEKKENGEMLLLSKSALDAKPYNEDITDSSWETSTLRLWLNGDFYETAFSKEEQERIIVHEVQNSGDDEFNTVPGNDTQDRVFLLSLREIHQYEDNIGICRATSFASSYLYPDEDGSVFFWLRDNMTTEDGVLPVAVIGGYSVLDENGDEICYPISWCGLDDGWVGVRPVIWIKG